MSGSNGDEPHLANMKDMVVAALGDRLAPGVEVYTDLFTEDAVLEVPFDDGLRVGGKAAIGRLVEALDGKTFLGPMTATGIYPSGDVVVVEYHGPVEDRTRGVSFEQNYISIFRLRDGRLARWREYLNPMVLPKNTQGSRA